jgi:isopentenyl diphosphate isomerase/L-lactate dehydrogenase-like FMN-dependent dehydrogenase
LAEFVSLQEIAIAAKSRMSPQAWDYLSGGSDSETTLKRNRYAIDSIAFRPRVFVDVHEIDTAASFLGFPLRIPVMLAPIGSLHLMHPAGAIPVVKAAERFGTVPFISTVTNPALEEVGPATKTPKIFQLYVRGDQSWVDDILDRALAAGFDALCITVDVAHYSRRERDLVNRFTRREFVKSPNLAKVSFDTEFNHQAALTWPFIEHFRQRTKLPIIVKGVATAEDAKLAVEHGVDAIYVSNHGGRQLDHGIGSIDALTEVVEVAKGKCPIIVDGGFTRGSDVIKALARGADAVAIGKLQGWALAAGGEEALVDALELLEREMIIAMGLLGVCRLSELGPRHLRAAMPMNPPHALSAYPLFTERFGS